MNEPVSYLLPSYRYMCMCNKSSILKYSDSFIECHTIIEDQTAPSSAKYCQLQTSNNCQRSRSYLDTIDTCQTRINLSEYPANKVWPSADHARDRQIGALLVLPITSGFSSSTTILPSRSCNTPKTVHTHYPR